MRNRTAVEHPWSTDLVMIYCPVVVRVCRIEHEIEVEFITTTFLISPPFQNYVRVSRCPPGATSAKRTAPLLALGRSAPRPFENVQACAKIRSLVQHQTSLPMGIYLYRQKRQLDPYERLRRQHLAQERHFKHSLMG